MTGPCTLERLVIVPDLSLLTRARSFGVLKAARYEREELPFEKVVLGILGLKIAYTKATANSGNNWIGYILEGLAGAAVNFRILLPQPISIKSSARLC